MELKGKHIFITGASSGIGKATAILAAKNGARLTLLARREKELEELLLLVNSINHLQNNKLVCDINNTDVLSQLIKNIDTIDGIVHAAGIVFPMLTKYISNKHIQKVWSTNAISPIILNSELLKENKINDSASFVFISSVSTAFPYVGGGLYSSSKAALEAYSKTLALELSSRKIRSNVVSPALVKTEIFEQTMASYTPEQIENFRNQYPLGFGESEDVANAIMFFLSDRSKWITGQNLQMDGGLTLNKH